MNKTSEKEIKWFYSSLCLLAFASARSLSYINKKETHQLKKIDIIWATISPFQIHRNEEQARTTTPAWSNERSHWNKHVPQDIIKFHSYHGDISHQQLWCL